MGRSRRRIMAERPKTCVGKAANQPIRLDRILHPGLGPAVGNAGFDCLFRHFPTLAVEQRELSTGLAQAALKITALRLAWPQSGRNVAGQMLRWRGARIVSSATRCSTHLSLPLTMRKHTLTRRFFRFDKPIG